MHCETRGLIMSGRIYYLLHVMLLGFASINSWAAETTVLPPAEPYCKWEMKELAINDPLCGLDGNAQRGKVIMTDSGQGNCVACHRLPVEGVEAFGNLGPPLSGVGSRYSEGFLRLRVVDTRQINPMSIMPGFYRDPALLHRPGKAYIGRTFLTAQQVEDVVAYLVTLK
jgi:sulfur-oxidizing protein SoxX